MSTAPEPSRRTALLGLLAELRGAGVAFASSEAFFEPAAEPAHVLKVVVDREPGLAEPFARAATAIGVPVVFLCRTAACARTASAAPCRGPMTCGGSASSATSSGSRSTSTGSTATCPPPCARPPRRSRTPAWS